MIERIKVYIKIEEIPLNKVGFFTREQVTMMIYDYRYQQSFEALKPEYEPVELYNDLPESMFVYRKIEKSELE